MPRQRPVIDPWEFANQQGDPGGNMSYDESKTWAESNAAQNPGWAGNASFRIEDGEAKDNRSWIERNGWIFPVAAGLGVGAGALAGSGGAAAASGAASSAGSGAASTAGLSALPGTALPASSLGTIAGITPTGGSVASSGGIGGFLRNLFGKNGLDPTALALGGMSLLGDDGPQDASLSSYEGAGVADPRASLQYVLQAITRMMAAVEERPPFQLSSSVVQGAPSPISVPGLPFQIGGGMATDPALRDPSLLSVDTSWMSKYQPSQGLAQQQFGVPPGGAPPSNPGARRRTPGGGM